MGNLSLTTSSAYALILIQVLRVFGIELPNDQADAIVNGIVSIALLAGVIYGRYRKGDITPLGVRK